jgi:hypothetical protein
MKETHEPMARASVAGASRAGSAYMPVARGLLYWLPMALGITVLAALVYLAVQQNFRQTANDPQIQMAEDAAAQLEEGRQPQAVVGESKVDMARSLAPFLIVYDDTGRPVASSAQLDGQTPSIPEGVFETVRQSGEDRISWQPRPGVRSATVITHFGGSHPGFVLAGRSLLEVEKRESQLTQMVAGAWIVALAGSLVLSVLAVAGGDRMLRRSED